MPAPDTPPVAPLFPAPPCWEKGDGQAQLALPPHGATSSPWSWEEQTLPHRPAAPEMLLEGPHELEVLAPTGGTSPGRGFHVGWHLGWAPWGWTLRKRVLRWAGAA